VEKSNNQGELIVDAVPQGVSLSSSPPPEFDDQVKLMTPCVDKEHLSAWFVKFLGLRFPDCIVSEHSTSSPMDFAWAVYDAAMSGRAIILIAVAGRESFKTLVLSAVELAIMLHDKRSVVHIGMTGKQASRAKDYLNKEVRNIPLVLGAISAQNATETKFLIDSSEISFEIISCTPKAVQGPHGSLVSFDEIASSIEPQNVKAYKDTSGIPGPSRDGKPPVIVKISSRQAGFSLMEVELDGAKTDKLREVHTWTIIEAMKRCPDERSGTTPVDLWINTLGGKHASVDEFALMRPEEKGDYSFHRVFDGCLKCPLLHVCKAQSKRQKSNSNLLMSVDTVLIKARGNAGMGSTNDHDWIISQLMSLKPSAQGLVLPQFNRKIHVGSWEKLAKVLTGQEHKNLDRVGFVRMARAAGCQFLAGVDFGWAHPTACVYACVDRRGNVYVLDSFAAVQMQDQDFGIMLMNGPHQLYQPETYVCDCEDPAGIAELVSAGLPAVPVLKDKGSVFKGITIIRSLLKVPGTNDMTKVYFHEGLDKQGMGFPDLISEMEKWSFKLDAAGTIVSEEPIDVNDDHISAFRYMLYHLMSGMVFISDGASGNVPGQAPLPEQQAVRNEMLQQAAMMSGVPVEDNLTAERYEPQAGTFRNPMEEKKPKKPGGDGSSGSSGGISWGWT